jgi:hypothetical protein
MHQVMGIWESSRDSDGSLGLLDGMSINSLARSPCVSAACVLPY